MPSPSAEAPLVKRLWLIFSQAVTVCCAAALVFELFHGRPDKSEQMPPDLIEAIASGGLAQAANDHSTAAEIAAPSVVNIFTRREVPGTHAEELGSTWNSDPELHMRALGSGVIVSTSGDVLTNYHVVEGAGSLFAALSDGRTFEARLIGSDSETDLALLKIDAKGLSAITIGRSEDLKVGQTVLAIGNPFDVGQSVTAGIVSALGRHGFGLNNYEDFIQTDAAINQGNSGGALVNLRGELVGINSAIFSPDLSEGFVGIGFAIPSSIVREVLPALMAGRQIKRGYLGFVPRQLSQELAQDLGLAVNAGVAVKQVIPGSPAERAGLRTFDVILSIGGTPVLRVNRMLQLIARTKPGTEVDVVVLRGSRKMRLRMIASERPKGSLEKEALIPPPNDDEDESAAAAKPDEGAGAPRAETRPVESLERKNAPAKRF